MADDFSSRRPARDANVDELLAASRRIERNLAGANQHLREAEVRKAREAPRFETPQRRPVEPGRTGGGVRTQPGAEERALVRTRQDVENELKATQRKFDQYRNQLYEQGKVPSRRSSTVRDFERQLGSLREERAGFGQAAQTPELQKRLELFRQGKSLTGQQTAAEVEQLAVIKQQVRAVQELRAAQRAPAATAAPAAAAPPPISVRDASSRLETLHGLRRQAEILQPSPGVVPVTAYRPGGAPVHAAEAETQRLAAEKRISVERQAGIARAAELEAALQAERIAAEEKIGLTRDQAGRPLVTYYGQAAGQPGTAPLGTQGLPGRPAAGPQGAGVVQQYQRGAEGSLASIAGVERAQRSLPRFYQQLQQGAAVQAQASQQMRRHGALTTEFLQALARGETTLSEFRFQIGSTIAKFAGWTAAATSVYGVVAAVSTLGRGAIDSLSGVNQLGRFVTNLDTERAQEQFRSLAREFHLPVADVVQGASGIAQVFHDQNQALEATRVVLTAVRVAELDVGDATNKLIPIVQGFKLNASDLADVLGAVNQAQNDFGVSIPDSLAGIGKAAGQLKAAGGDFYTATAFIATAKRVTGQSGDAIGTALRRSAILIRRPSNREVLERYGIDPDADYNTILNESLKLGQKLSKQGATGGKQLSELATKGLATPQIGPIFTAVLQNRDLFERVFRDIQPDKARVGLARELRFVLSSIRDQFKSIKAEAEAIGAGLAQAGFFDAFGVLLQTIRLTLSLANDLLTTFNNLPAPLKKSAAYLLEAYVALRLLRRTGIGPGLAQRNQAFGFLGYSQPEQLRRGAIANQRNISQGFANQAEQVGNRYQAASIGAATSASAAVAARERSLALQSAANVDQRLVAQADREALTYSQQALRFNEEALALKREQVTVAAGLAESDAILLGLQKKQILPSEAARRQGGALYVTSPGGESQRVTTADARKVEAGGKLDQAAGATVAAGAAQTKLAGSYENLGRAATGAGAAAAQMAVQAEVAAVAAARETVEINATVGTKAVLAAAHERLGIAYSAAAASAAEAAAAAAGTAAGSSVAAATATTESAALDALGVAQTELAAAQKRLGVAVAFVAKAETAAELAIAESAVAAELATVAAAGELVALETAAVSQGRLAASYALLGRGLTTAAAAGAAIARGLGPLLFNPLVLGIAALEILPRIYHSGVERIKQEQQRAAALARDPESRSDLQSIIDKARQTVKEGTRKDGPLGVVQRYAIPNPFRGPQHSSEEQHIAATTLAAEQAVADAQGRARAAGQAVPLRFVQSIRKDFEREVTAFRQGRLSSVELEAAYKKRKEELDRSRQATSGTAAGAKDVAAGEKAFGLALLVAAQGQNQIAESLKGLGLKEIATALQQEAEKIAVFGAQPGDRQRIRAQYAAAAEKVSKDPSPQNLKDYGLGKQAVDAALQDAQTQLQQSLTLATTGPQREAAYAQFFQKIQSSGVGGLRTKLTEGGQGIAATRARLLQAQKAQRQLQGRYDDAQLRSAPGLLDPGQQFEQQLGAPSVGRPLGSESANDQTKKELEAQKKNVQALHAQIRTQRKGVKNLRLLYERDKKAYEALKREFEQQQAQTENQVAELQAQIYAGRTSDPVEAITIQLRAAHRALQNDIKHHVGQEQRLQDELKIQALQDQQLQAQIQQLQTQTALTTSAIDPTNTAAVDRSNLSGLYQELAKARAGRPSPGRTDQIKQIQTQINQSRFQQAQNLRQQGQAENDAYYNYLEAGQGALHPLRVAQLEYEKALHALRFAHGKVERLQALANIRSAQEALAEAVHQNAIDEVNAFFGLAESKTTDPLRLAQLEYQRALSLQKKARGPKEKQQTAIDKNNALKNLYQTQADERLKTIEFEASIDKITSDQEIGALKNLLKLKHLTKDFRRQILTQIHQLENQDSGSVELNVGNIRLPTLYDVRRLAAQGTNNQPVYAPQTITVSIDGAGDPEATAYAVSAVLNKHTRTHHKAAQRAAGIR